MQSKKMFFWGIIFCGLVCVAGARAEKIVEEVIEEVDMEQLSADAVMAYNPDGSLFQQITDLEQEKVLMQLEKERAQLNLDLDRLAAEKIKLHMEIDTLSGRAEQQQQEFETERARLEAEAKRLEIEKDALVSKQQDIIQQQAQPVVPAPAPVQVSAEKSRDTSIEKDYKLVNE